MIVGFEEYTTKSTKKELEHFDININEPWWEFILELSPVALTGESGIVNLVVIENWGLREKTQGQIQVWNLDTEVKMLTDSLLKVNKLFKCEHQTMQHTRKWCWNGASLVWQF